MASGFPGSIDSFTNPLSNSALNSPSHAGQHQDLNDAVNKVETYMGLVKVIPTSATNGTVAANGTVTIGNAVSSVTVNGAFSSLYDNYRIVYSNVAPSVNNDLTVQLTVAGTASTTGYYWAFTYVTLATSAVTGSGQQNFSSHHISSVTSTSFRHAGAIEMYMPFLTAYTGIIATDYIMRTDIVSSGTNGSHQVATSYDGFRIVPGSGTLTGGTIRIYGYRN